jgi:hypothetical protein
MSDSNAMGKNLPTICEMCCTIRDAPNCLLSLSRIDDAGGRVEFGKGMCWIRNGKDVIVGSEEKHQRLYLLKAKTILEEPEVRTTH